MNRKVIVMCGSYKFQQLMQEVAERLELEYGYAVIPVLPHVLNRELTGEEKALLGELHLRKIDLADAVYVVNPGGYIGDSVRCEIAYAREKGKEILYFEAKYSENFVDFS